MPGPARAGALIYAKDLGRFSAFYQRVLGMQLLHVDAEHHVIESGDMPLNPCHSAAHRRYLHHFDSARVAYGTGHQTFFTVADLAGATAVALFGSEYAGPGFRARNGHDPEGNVFHLRERA